MIIRPARTADAAAVSAIWNREIREGISTFKTAEIPPEDMGRDIARKKTQGYPFMVAESAGHCVGFATCGAFRAATGYQQTWESTIYLGAAARGHGAGSALMQALECQAAESNVHSLIAAISGENSAAIRFHQALGFVQVAQVPKAARKFDRWFDLVLMQKLLCGAA